MSAGSMSLVNWMRWNCSPSERASTCASVVLPTPGRSSISRWPRASRQASARRICVSLPRMTLLAASMTRAMGARPRSCGWNSALRSMRRLYSMRYDANASRHPRHAPRHSSRTPTACKHDMGAHHPERPARLAAIEDQLIASRRRAAPAALRGAARHRRAARARASDRVRARDPRGRAASSGTRPPRPGHGDEPVHA